MNKLSEIINKLNEGSITKEHPENFIRMFGYPKSEFFKLLINKYRESSEGREFAGKLLTAENAHQYVDRLLLWTHENMELSEIDIKKLRNYITKSDEIQTELTEDKTEESYTISFRTGPKYTLKEVMGLLHILKSMGSMGSSRRIGVMDDKGWDSFDFDGDGQSWIDDIKVNGKELGKNWEKEIKDL